MLISAGEDHFVLSWRAADDAPAFAAGLFERDAAGGGFGIFFHLCLACGVLTPPG